MTDPLCDIRQKLAHHLAADTDPCQDRGASWPCDVADALRTAKFYIAPHVRAAVLLDAANEIEPSPGAFSQSVDNSLTYASGRDAARWLRHRAATLLQESTGD